MPLYFEFRGLSPDVIGGRVLIRGNISDDEGPAWAGAYVTLRRPGTTEPIDDILYDASSGGSVLANPLTTTADGQFSAWVDFPGINIPGTVDVYVDNGPSGMVTVGHQARVIAPYTEPLDFDRGLGIHREEVTHVAVGREPNIFFVDPEAGDDDFGVGVVGRWDYPFMTLEAAVAASLAPDGSGQSWDIVVRGGPGTDIEYTSPGPPPVYAVPIVPTFEIDAPILIPAQTRILAPTGSGKGSSACGLVVASAAFAAAHPGEPLFQLKRGAVLRGFALTNTAPDGIGALIGTTTTGHTRIEDSVAWGCLGAGFVFESISCDGAGLYRCGSYQNAQGVELRPYGGGAPNHVLVDDCDLSSNLGYNVYAHRNRLDGGGAGLYLHHNRSHGTNIKVYLAGWRGVNINGGYYEWAGDGGDGPMIVLDIAEDGLAASTPESQWCRDVFLSGGIRLHGGRKSVDFPAASGVWVDAKYALGFQYHDVRGDGAGSGADPVATQPLVYLHPDTKACIINIDNAARGDGTVYGSLAGAPGILVADEGVGNYGRYFDGAIWHMIGTGPV